MSWSLVETPRNAEGIKKLEDQIRIAADKNILLYCAATDKAPYDDDTRLYPQDSDTKHILIVGSARENGEESSFVNLAQVDYLFPGEGITELDDQKGSSAAAALAAGFSALILWCFRKNPPHQIPSCILNPTNMHYVFESLKDSGSKWINVTKMIGLKDIKTMDEVVTYCTSVTTLRAGKQTRGCFIGEIGSR
ncbi:uncharacterized protein Triagg1_2148 [Trichoderma aggressivum f. europaeum]|uniref:Peptidase S8/S53 domain-containing protein n=1 Tax=Trichoderma aggressivum f. europaeum TaxID=173218 RepID=A0AAE1M3I8_9HYPO|nr:hypothetical protein Triagg1_2148 [Trichoderma aggressivum f. europaeum]